MKIKQSIDLEYVMQELQIAVFCIDFEGEIIDITGNTAILGNKYKEINRNLFSFFPFEESEKIKSSILELSPTIKNKTAYIGYTANNQTLYFKVNISLHQESNHYLLISFTKEKLNEQIPFSQSNFPLDYDSLYENEPVMHVSFDSNTKQIITCNNLVIDTLGLVEKRNIIGKPLDVIFSPESAKKLPSLFKQFKREKFLKNEEIEIINTRGKTIPSILYATNNKCVTEDGTLICRFTIVDVSELKKAQKKLQHKRTYLELLNNELEQFVYTCSHDLQEPLATIKFAGGVLNKLYGENLDEKGRKYLAYIDEAVDRLTDQIKLLLNHAKIGDGIQKTEVHLKDALNDAVKDLGKRISESEAVISIPEKLPKIYGYKTELRLLFLNLISNAIKYKKAESIPQIIIQVNEFDTYVEFLISDNGIGIDSVDTKEVFKIFNRVNQGDPNKGSSIGLAHCQKIVQMHSGKIYVKSALNSGSTFVFTLKK